MVDNLACFQYLVTVALNLLILGLRLDVLAVSFGVFVRLWGRTLDPVFDFLGKGSNKNTKNEKTQGAEMDAFSMEFKVFLENAKVRFDCVVPTA